MNQKQATTNARELMKQAQKLSAISEKVVDLDDEAQEIHHYISMARVKVLARAAFFRGLAEDASLEQSELPF